MALTLGQTAQGKYAPNLHQHFRQHHHPGKMLMPSVKGMRLPTVIKWQYRIIAHDEWVIRTRTKHDPKVVKWHRAQLMWTSTELSQSLSLWHRLLYLRSQQRMLAGVCTSCWDRVASCESGQNWSDNTGNNFYGGLQFTITTWLNSGGGRYASRADYATREQQIAIASHLSLSNWPVCGARY